MSGGAYDYAYRHVEEFAHNMQRDGRCSASLPALREAFREHLLKVSQAMRAIEWNDSGDGCDEEIALLESIISPREELSGVLKSVRNDLEQLSLAVARVESSNK